MFQNELNLCEILCNLLQISTEEIEDQIKYDVYTLLPYTEADVTVLQPNYDNLGEPQPSTSTGGPADGHTTQPLPGPVTIPQPQPLTSTGGFTVKNTVTQSLPSSPLPNIYEFMGVDPLTASEEELDDILKALRLQYYLECKEVERFHDARKIRSEIDTLLSLPVDHDELDEFITISESEDEMVKEMESKPTADLDWIPSSRIQLPPPSSLWSTRLCTPDRG